MLCNFVPRKFITAKHITQVIWWSTFHTNLWLEGVNLDHIDFHSIWASGAMQLYLNAAPEATIMKIGRWHSHT
jgi:hypothetical protein